MSCLYQKFDVSNSSVPNGPNGNQILNHMFSLMNNEAANNISALLSKRRLSEYIVPSSAGTEDVTISKVTPPDLARPIPHRVKQTIQNEDLAHNGLLTFLSSVNKNKPVDHDQICLKLASEDSNPHFNPFVSNYFNCRRMSAPACFSDSSQCQTIANVTQTPPLEKNLANYYSRKMELLQKILIEQQLLELLNLSKRYSEYSHERMNFSTFSTMPLLSGGQTKRDLLTMGVQPKSPSISSSPNLSETSSTYAGRKIATIGDEEKYLSPQT